MFTYFADCSSLEEVKRTYKQLALKHHPDCGGDDETMKAINAEYEQAFNHFVSDDTTSQETPDEFKAIINGLVVLKGITIELCGKWLWIGGDTYNNREELKRLGCRFSHNKKMWYWRPADEQSYFYRGSKTMNEIRHIYGSRFIAKTDKDTKEKALTA